MKACKESLIYFADTNFCMDAACCNISRRDGCGKA